MEIFLRHPSLPKAMEVVNGITQQLMNLVLAVTPGGWSGYEQL